MFYNKTEVFLTAIGVTAGALMALATIGTTQAQSAEIYDLGQSEETESQINAVIRVTYCPPSWDPRSAGALILPIEVPFEGKTYSATTEAGLSYIEVNLRLAWCQWEVQYF